MKALYLASTMLTLAVAAQAQTITPGNGPLTDPADNTWAITPSGSIHEGDQWTPGGGGTAALTIIDGKVLGLDAHGKGWFALSGNGQDWASTPTPLGLTGIANQPAVQTTTTSTASTAAQTNTLVIPPATCAPTAAGAATGGFTTSNGQIYGPDGKPFIAKGVNVYDSAMGNAAQILQDFPGINFIRLAAYSYQQPAAYQAFINQMTAAHVVVEIEHHVGAGGGVPPLSGQALSAENAWFGSLAGAFKSNPYVWFGTLNEPDDGGGNAGVLANEMQANYDTIRSAGSNAIIMLSVGGSPPTVAMGNKVNVVIDQHYYGWISHYSTDQATVNAGLNALVTADQQAMTATGKPPVIIGEYGPSTAGQSDDPNANQVIAAVTGSGLGSAAWNFDAQAPADNLTQNGVMTQFGAQVAGYFALTKDAAPSVWSVSCSSAAVSAIAGLSSSDTSSPESPPPSQVVTDQAEPSEPYYPPGAQQFLQQHANLIQHGADLLARVQQ